MDKQEIKKMVDAFPGRALNYNVVLRQIENKNVTEGNIDISMASDKNEKYKKGIVVSMGTECPKRSLVVWGITIPFIKFSDIKVGDEVIFDSYKASLVTLDTIEYTVIFYADLVHVL